MIYKPYFPVIGARRDILGTITPSQISGEQHHVVDGYIKLHEVPQYIASAQNVIIPGYTEVSSEPTGYQFRVNYATGRIFFATGQEGALVTVSYKGLGSLTAVDEINWLWEQLTTRNSFANLNDCPGDFGGHAYEYLQVNKTETGLEFTAPTVGRSTCRFFPLTLAANASTVVDGGNNDVVTIYEVIARQEAGTQAPGTWDVSPAGTIVLVDGGEDGDTYQLASPAAGVTGMMRANEMVDLADWNNVQGITITGSTPAGTAMSFMFVVDGSPCKLDVHKMTPIGVSGPEDVFTYGLTQEELSGLPAAAFNDLVGRKVGLIVAMSTTGSTTPFFDGILQLYGEKGGGYTLADYITITMSTQTKKWSFKNTATSSKNVLVVIGSGRDDICCSSDALMFESVPAGGSVHIKAPKQTVLQVYKALAAAAETGFSLTSPLGWVSVDGVLESTIGTPTDMRVQQIPQAKALNLSYSNVFSLLDVENGGIGDKLGRYTFTNVGAKTVVPGFAGPALYMADMSHIRISDSWVFESSQAGHVSGVVYVPRTIGGLFRWVSGYPMIISPYCGQGYIAGAGGWYMNCAAYLASNYVMFNCGRVWKSIPYIPGSWVHVAITSMYGCWIAGARDDKYMVGWVNGSTVGLYHKESSNTSYLDRNFAVPGAIGNGASQIPTTGGFIVDHAFVIREANPGGTILGRLDIYPREKRAEAYAARKFYLYKTAQVIGDLTWPQVKSFAVAQKPSMAKNIAKYMVESEDILYTYDFQAGAFTPVSKDQPLESMWAVAIPEGMVSSIPDWKLDTIASTNMRVWAISGMGETNANDTPLDLYGGEVARIYAGLTVSIEDKMQAWAMLRPATDYTLTWVDEAKSWKLTNNTSSELTLRVVVSGQAAQDALAAASLFTDLADTPDSINWPGQRLLVAGDGIVTTRPYINPLMMVQP